MQRFNEMCHTGFDNIETHLLLRGPRKQLTIAHFLVLIAN
jgi:hypothetical protein